MWEIDRRRFVELPRVGPIGVIHHPEGYLASARRYPLSLRVTTFVVLGSFLGVTIVTTAYSLGAYCVTTWAGNPFGGF